jgi:hypothetical protein
MKDYQQENQDILDEWQDLSNKKKDKNVTFVQDGLMYRGAIFYKDNCWYRKKGNENFLWGNVFPRIMLLTKEFNDPEGNTDDIRHETCRKNFTGESNIITSNLQFHKNIMHHVYGLANYKNGKCPPYQELNLDTCRNFYETYPLVRINVKKQTGGCTIKNDTISYYIKTYANPLKKQIELFDADIIICYGRAIFNYIISTFFPDIKEEENDPWIYFSEKRQKVIINSYHPSYYFYSIKNFYEYPIKEFETMMLSHRNFADKYNWVKIKFKEQLL